MCSMQAPRSPDRSPPQRPRASRLATSYGEPAVTPCSLTPPRSARALGPSGHGASSMASGPCAIVEGLGGGASNVASSQMLEAPMTGRVLQEMAESLAMANHRGASSSTFSPTLESSVPGRVGHEMADSIAVANYGVQLKAWTDRQVDERVGHLLRSLDIEGMRANIAQAVAASQQLEGEVRALRESHQALFEAYREQQTLNAMQQKLQAFEQRLCDWRDQMQAEVQERFSAGPPKVFQDQTVASAVAAVEKRLGLAREDEGLTLATLQCTLDLRIDETKHALLARTDELKRDFEARGEQTKLDLQQQVSQLRLRFSEDMAATEQRVLSVMRADMAAAFRNEAAAVTALDQRLRSGIGELAASRGRASGAASKAGGSPVVTSVAATRPLVDTTGRAGLADDGVAVSLRRRESEAPPWSGIQDAVLNSGTSSSAEPPSGSPGTLVPARPPDNFMTTFTRPWAAASTAGGRQQGTLQDRAWDAAWSELSSLGMLPSGTPMDLSDAAIGLS